MSMNQVLNEFRTARRQSEYDIVHLLLPRVVCNLILDYSQLDDGIVQRFDKINFMINDDVNIMSLVMDYDDGLYTLMCTAPFGNDSFMYVREKYVDVFVACYDDNSEFANNLMRKVNSLHILAERVNLQDLNETIVEYIKWPIHDFWLSG